MKICTFCGTELRDDDVFCYGCGNKYKAPEFDPSKCKFCGTRLLEGARFCLCCGESVNGEKNPYKKTIHE